MARTEFAGNILTVRAVEDCIRATRKYSEGVNSKLFSRHPAQGEQFPSRVLTKYYEVAPEAKDDEYSCWLDKPATIETGATLADWLWGDTPRVDVLFRYNYPTNRAWILIYGGEPALALLKDKIPGLTTALSRVVAPSGDAVIPAPRHPELPPIVVHDAK